MPTALSCSKRDRNAEAAFVQLMGPAWREADVPRLGSRSAAQSCGAPRAVNETRASLEEACPSRDGDRWHVGRFAPCPAVSSAEGKRSLPFRAECPLQVSS